MYSRSAFVSPSLHPLINALRLSALPDVLVPQIERMAAPLSSWRDVDGRQELSLAVPGLAPSDIKVDVDERVINISLSKSNHTAQLRTRAPQGADTSSLEARLSRGMLTLSLGMLPQRQPRSIEVVEVQESERVSPSNAQEDNSSSEAE